MKTYTDQQLKNLDRLIELIKIENENQVLKWGIQERSIFEWMTYLTEEVGELAEAITEHEYRLENSIDIIKEAVQVAILALKIAEMYREVI